MYTIVFFTFSILLFLLFFFDLRLFARTKNRFTLMAALVVFGLAYDNFVIALGTYLGESTLLEMLNMGRYVIHAVVTPLLIMFAVDLARRLGVEWAEKPAVIASFGILTLLMIMLGVFMDIVGLDIVPVMEDGLLRYAPTEPMPPIPSIVTIIVMIGFGAVVWRKIKWPWLCLGSIFMFVAAGAGVGLLIVGNFGELAFTSSIVATDYHVSGLGERKETEEEIIETAVA